MKLIFLIIKTKIIPECRCKLIPLISSIFPLNSASQLHDWPLNFLNGLKMQNKKHVFS